MSPRTFIRKVISIRSHLLRTGKSGKNYLLMCRYMDRVKGWTEAWPNASEGAVRTFIRQHADEIRELLPGKGNPAHEKLSRELDQLVSNQIQSI